MTSKKLLAVNDIITDEIDDYSYVITAVRRYSYITRDVETSETFTFFHEDIDVDTATVKYDE